MNQLTNRLHDLAGPEPTSRPPVATILQRGRRARRRRRAVRAASIGGVAVVVTRPGPAGPAPRDRATAAAPTPRLDLVAAIAASQNISYKIKINVALRTTGRAMSDEDQRLWAYVGEKGHDVNG